MSQIDHNKEVSAHFEKMSPQIASWIKSGRLNADSEKQLEKISASIWKMVEASDLAGKSQNSDFVKIAFELIEKINRKHGIDIPTLGGQ